MDKIYNDPVLDKPLIRDSDAMMMNRRIKRTLELDMGDLNALDADAADDAFKMVYRKRIDNYEEWLANLPEKYGYIPVITLFEAMRHSISLMDTSKLYRSIAKLESYIMLIDQVRRDAQS